MTKNILILPGWASHQANWKPFIKSLDQKGYQVFKPHMPGFGRQKINRPWSTQDYVNWLASFLKIEKINKIILIGHSFGGQVAIHYTSQNPRKVSRLVLINSGGIRPKITLKRSFFFVLAKTGKIIFTLPILNKLKNLAKEMLYKTAREGDYYHASEVMKKTLQIVTLEDQKNNLMKIKTPALLLWGQKDSSTPVKDGYLMQKLLPNSKLTVFSQARHSLPFTHTQKVIKKILWFTS